ncbi:MAG: hypothetical protein ACK5X3_06605, partial [Pseudomonadota bacterium]
MDRPRDVGTGGDGVRTERHIDSVQPPVAPCRPTPKGKSRQREALARRQETYTSLQAGRLAESSRGKWDH